MIEPRIAVAREDIENVVRVFYDRVRHDDVLGPVFANHIADWSLHEEKITRFWANAILFERAYDGNPMSKHMQARDVYPEHFEPWLRLFDETLNDLISSPQREQWSNLVHRIGRGLSMGVSDAQRPAGAVPKF